MLSTLVITEAQLACESGPVRHEFAKWSIQPLQLETVLQNAT